MRFWQGQGRRQPGFMIRQAWLFAVTCTMEVIAMKVFLIVMPDVVIVRRRVEGGGIVGDAVEEIRQDEEFYGVSYADLAKMGSGEHEITDLQDIPA